MISNQSALQQIFAALGLSQTGEGATSGQKATGDAASFGSLLEALTGSAQGQADGKGARMNLGHAQGFTGSVSSGNEGGGAKSQDMTSQVPAIATFPDGEEAIWTANTGETGKTVTIPTLFPQAGDPDWQRAAKGKTTNGDVVDGQFLDGDKAGLSGTDMAQQAGLLAQSAGQALAHDVLGKGKGQTTQTGAGIVADGTKVGAGKAGQSGMPVQQGVSTLGKESSAAPLTTTHAKGSDGKGVPEAGGLLTGAAAQGQGALAKVSGENDQAQVAGQVREAVGQASVGKHEKIGETGQMRGQQVASASSGEPLSSQGSSKANAPATDQAAPVLLPQKSAQGAVQATHGQQQVVSGEQALASVATKNMQAADTQRAGTGDLSNVRPSTPSGDPARATQTTAGQDGVLTGVAGRAGSLVQAGLAGDTLQGTTDGARLDSLGTEQAEQAETPVAHARKVAAKAEVTTAQALAHGNASKGGAGRQLQGENPLIGEDARDVLQGSAGQDDLAASDLPEPRVSFAKYLGGGRSEFAALARGFQPQQAVPQPQATPAAGLTLPQMEQAIMDPAIGLDGLVDGLDGFDGTLQMQRLEAAGLPTDGARAAQPRVPLPGLAADITRQVQNGETRFTVRLDPADLGSVDVDMTIDETGRVTARLMVERPETLELLQRDAQTLERALNAAGLKSDQSGLEFSLKQNKGEQQGQSGDGQDDANGEQTGGTDSADGTATEHLVASSGLDIRV